MPESAIPAYITSLIRHFEDLRDGTHGGSASRKDKEAHFEKAVQLLAPIARQVLTELNTSLLLDTGQLTETGLRRTADGGLIASWVLSWPEQQAAGVEPIALQAYFGGGFHHPHLRGTTVHDWPLNVCSATRMPRLSYPYYGPSRPAICTIWFIARTTGLSLPLIALRVRDQLDLDYAFPSKTRYSPQSTRRESRSVHFRLFR
jgi:hypothetical protein